ncbi:DUF2326 domain-containing protein [Clostridium perfringens]|uniref:DUF2326 domain-containing protein n=1 Tax=Clostridium perfringens TaxID=1502 RepID=UPI000F8CDB04|nr:DUF2326 domain-containing protein [Clostridium perfringens]RUR40505.1 DUF2326 domain-containing protein [Clostridium perfringens]
MYIKKLSANNFSFNNIEFLENRVNLILGTKISNKKGKSTNGVGKTLSVKIIDFCLGADVKKNSENSELLKLDDWIFYLDVIIDNKKINIARSIKDRNNISINNQIFKIRDFKEYMERNLFEIPEEKTDISYRGLISRFIRMPLKGYVDWRFCKEKEQECNALLNNSFFLNLDLSIIQKKIDLKDTINNLNNNRKIIKNDENIKEIIKGKNIGVNISSLKRDLRNLEEKIENFKVSEEYNDRKLELENIKIEKNNLINQIVTIQNIIDNINKSLDIKYDISSERVVELYKSAKVNLGDSVIKTLDEVSKLHSELLINRKERLKKDKLKYLDEIKKIKKEISIYDNKIDNDMEFLIGKGTLEEYNNLTARVTDLKLKIQKLEEYDNIISGLDKKIAEEKVYLAEENVTAEEYVETNPIEKFSEKFKGYVDYIYNSEKFSGIVLANNSKDNKIRFDLNPEIDGEKSAGINNVKIFCMDMLRLGERVNNTVGFIYHDSTLFSEIDPRQIYFMLKLAKNICDDNNVQYILNLNYDIFNNVISVAKLENDIEFIEYLNEGIVMRLKDDNVGNKLLGIQI